MATDIKLDQQGGDWLIVEGRILKTTASDFMLDSPARRRGGPSPFRRALVHNEQDGLTINFGGDYPGGVTVTGNLVVTGDLKVAGTAVGAAIAGLQSAINLLQGTAEHVGQLDKSVASIIQMLGAVVIPPWRTKTEVEEGDDMGMSTLSAEQLGLVVQYEIDQRNPNFAHEEVISIKPPDGTVVMPGTTVVVTINLEG